MIIGVAATFVAGLLLSRVYLIPFMIAVVIVSTATIDGATAWNVPFFAFVTLSIFDMLAPRWQRLQRPTEGRFPQIRHFLSRGLLWAWFLVQLSVVPYVIVRLSGAGLDGRFISIAVAVGIMTGGVGIIVAHEFMHSGRSNEWFAAEVLMTTVLYTHFCVEHIFGHHVRVGTLEDPATARRGESLYRFFPRTIIGGFRSFLDIEQRRRVREQIGRLSPLNRTLRYPAMIAAAIAIAVVLGGWTGLVFFIVQSAVAVLLLESVNYIEHYGLTREKNETGGYERIATQHSWDNDRRFTNGMLFNLGRHSDHHLNARQSYVDLKSSEGAPEMPFGYTGMIVLAAIPWAWFALVNRKLDRLECSR